MDVLPMKKSILFIGNPGTGKSTLLNCCLGEIVFLGGLAMDGRGLTRHLQSKEANGIEYLDTPGLNDNEARSECAREIQKALKRGGNFRVFFIVALRGGRIYADDIQTIKLVLEAAPEIQDSYSIIINKLEAPLVNHHTNNPEVRQRWVDPLPHRCKSWFLFPKDERLMQEAPCLIRLPPPFLKFIEDAPTCVISSVNVRQLDIQRFQQEVDALEGVEVELLRVSKLAKLSTMVPVNIENKPDGIKQVQILLSSTVANLVLIGVGATGFNWVPAPPQVHVWFGRLLGPTERLCDCQVGEGDLLYFSKDPIPAGPPYTAAERQQKDAERMTRINARLDAEFDDEFQRATIQSQRRYEKIEIEKQFSADMDEAEQQSVHDERLRQREAEELEAATIASQSEASRRQWEEDVQYREAMRKSVEDEQQARQRAYAAEEEQRRREEEIHFQEALRKSELEYQPPIQPQEDDMARATRLSFEAYQVKERKRNEPIQQGPQCHLCGGSFSNVNDLQEHLALHAEYK